MNLLKDGIEQQAVIKTVQTRKLTVDGLTKAYPRQARGQKCFVHDCHQVSLSPILVLLLNCWKISSLLHMF